MVQKKKEARRWFVRGRVQGVCFRSFTQKAAMGLGLSGFARNLDDGRVEVYAVGPGNKLSELAGMLHLGPQGADVRGVEEIEDAIQDYGAFRIEP
jgi:acylphosphatase